MLEAVFIVVAIGIAAVIAARWRGGAARDDTSPTDLTTPLRRELWRQGSTPEYGTDTRGTALTPVLAYELYPVDLRKLYDWSRELDVEFLALLRRTADDVMMIRHAHLMQSVTRGVRRGLIELAVAGRPGLSAESSALETLGNRLAVVAETLARLSAGADA
jgi:hypothetical protein